MATRDPEATIPRIGASDRPARRSRARTLGWWALACYVATIASANLMLSQGVFVDMGFGLVAPGAVFAIGLTFTLRDLVQSAFGPWVAVAAIVVGCALVGVSAPGFALASATSLLVSELADLAVYTPVARRSWIGAVVLSNTVGLVVDSWLFLTLAFGSLALLPGQLAGKLLVTLVVILPLLLLRRGRRGVLAGNA